jgi:hypothetical protein
LINSLLPPVICLYFTLLAIGVLVFGVSSDALAIALAIIGAALAISLPITFEMRSQRGNMTRMNTFLKRTTLSHIDEKVAMLRGYTLDVKQWQNIEHGVTTMTDRIVNDITAIVRVRKYIGDDQMIKLNEAIRHLRDSMSAINYDVGRIDDVSKLLNSR